MPDTGRSHGVRSANAHLDASRACTKSSPKLLTIPQAVKTRVTGGLLR
jgi:hypothetical protein